MAKTLFNSTEESNFILNMTEEQYSKLASYGLLGACLLVPVFTIIPECMTTANYTIAAGGLAVTGVYCMIMALIALIKKYIRGKAVIPVCAVGAIFLWSIVSLINSYDPMVSLYGFPERSEGVLAVMFYSCIFITAAAVKRETVVKVLLKGLVGTGIINSVWALIQIFTGKLSRYSMIALNLQVNAASGLAHSPLFLAMLLTLSLTAALLTAVFTENKKYRIICIISGLLFSFAMMFTYSFIGICGIVFAVLAAVIAKPKKSILPSLSAVLGAALAVVVVISGIIGGIPNSYKLYDGRELWWSDSYMRIGASGDFNKEVLDIDNTLDVYLYLNKKTMNIISQNPLTGTGPDQLVYPQLYTYGGLKEDTDVKDLIINNKGTFDRTYNEYLYTGATRGIPSMIALIVTVLSALVMGFKSMRKKKSFESKAVFVLALGGALLFLIGCTNLAFSPIFWAVAGLACAAFAEEKTDVKAKK